MSAIFLKKKFQRLDLLSNIQAVMHVRVKYMKQIAAFFISVWLAFPVFVLLAHHHDLNQNASHCSECLALAASTMAVVVDTDVATSCVLLQENLPTKTFVFISHNVSALERCRGPPAFSKV